MAQPDNENGHFKGLQSPSRQSHSRLGGKSWVRWKGHHEDCWFLVFQQRRGVRVLGGFDGAKIEVIWVCNDGIKAWIFDEGAAQRDGTRVG